MPILLTELTLMLLIFTLCAGICLSIFFKSRDIAEYSGALSRAAMWAQSAAEAYKAAGGDAAEAAALLGAAETGITVNNAGFLLSFDREWQPVGTAEAFYVLSLTEEADNAAKVEVTESDESLIVLRVKAVPNE